MTKDHAMFDLPDTGALYAALSARDPAFDGRAYVGVTTTGIFCRLTCPARKPRPVSYTHLTLPTNREV